MIPIRKLTRWVPALLILLFMYTGFSKLFGMEKFTGTMLDQPIPHGLAAILAWVVPAAEILTAVMQFKNWLVQPKNKSGLRPEKQLTVQAGSGI